MNLQKFIRSSIQSGDAKTVLAGIDIETPELLLTDRLNEKGRAIDLVPVHHPEGRAYANFYEKHHIHGVIAGHISSDTLGLNLLLDALDKQGPIAVVEFSVFKRIRRQS